MESRRRGCASGGGTGPGGEGNGMLRNILMLAISDRDRRAVLRHLLAGEYDLLEADSGRQAMVLMEQNSGRIAAALIESGMRLDDNGDMLVSAMLKKGLLDAFPAVVVLPGSYADPLADRRPDTNGYAMPGADELFSAGVLDVMYQDTPGSVMRQRLRNLRELYSYRKHIEQRLADRIDAQRRSGESMVDMLTSIIEYRNVDTGRHVLRLRSYTRVMLEEVARCCPEYGLTEREIDRIVSASVFHDIGKISVPEQVLKKPGPLTDWEMSAMRRHVEAGCRILKTIEGVSDADYMKYAYDICRCHHERYDGGGYPAGLRGEAIPICAQVVGLTDAFEALTNERVYSPAYSYTQAANMIMNGECGAFSPQLLECFKSVGARLRELLEEYERLSSGEHGAKQALKHRKGEKPLGGSVGGGLAAKGRTGALERTEQKYRTLAAYLNRKIVELDFDGQQYQVVFDPEPSSGLPEDELAFEQVLARLMGRQAHTENEKTPAQVCDECCSALFTSGEHRYTFKYKIYSPSAGEYVPGEAVFIRLDLPGRRALMLCRALDTDECRLSDAAGGEETDTRMERELLGLVSGVFVCRRDEGWTIVEGGSGLHSLLGYTRQEIEQRFSGRLADMVLPEDRENAKQRLAEQLRQGDSIELEYRLVRKDGGTIWVLDKSRLVTGRDGREYFYCTLADNSRSKAMQDKLNMALERNSIIIEQTDDIVFEWDVESDEFLCSDKWEKRFGYEPEYKPGQLVPLVTYIHPDDAQELAERVQHMDAKTSRVEADLRIIDSGGRYLWNRVRATIQRDGSGEVAMVVGVIMDVDVSKRRELELQERAERDALTGLLNKASVRERIEEYLASAHGERAALLMIDLDDFKHVNDSYGHMFGDEVLTRAAQEINRLFRSGDIVGRVGGDEFVALMKNIPDARLVEDRCTRLLAAFEKAFAAVMPSDPISCSVGAALAPEDGAVFEELFKHADSALYRAKELGKNRFVFYDRQQAHAAADTAVNERIDSDSVPADTEDDILDYAFETLRTGRNTDEAVDSVLAAVGRHIGASRVYIFENNDDDTAFSNTFEWCGQGVRPEKASLQDLKFADVPGWWDNYDEKGIFYCPDITQLPREQRTMLEFQGIKSMLQCAIRDRGVYKGLVGFDECSVNRLWTQKQIKMLMRLSELLAVYLLKRRLERRVAESGAQAGAAP